jgi:hypothetical protein
MIIEPVLPIVPRLIAMLLPVIANLVAVLLPILPYLAPVALRRSIGSCVSVKPIAERVAALFGSTVRQLAGPRSSIAQTRKRGRAIVHAVGNAGARRGAQAGRR